MKSSQRAFTLVELSIVIVVVGLITGGVMLGQSLVRASQINSISVDLSRVKQSFEMFKEKYRALPGDFAGATTVWGEISASCTDAQSTTKATCNGNGNGLINTYESLRAWQHLANAGMMEGSYTGGPTVPATSSFTGRIGLNYPSTAFESVSMLVNTGVPSDYPNLIRYTDVIGHLLMYGRLTIDTADAPRRPFLTAAEMKGVDSKIDDGKPAYGKITAGLSTSTYTPGCTTTDVNTTAEYSITSRNILCAFWYNLSDGF